MLLKLKNDTEITIQDFALNGFTAHAEVESMADYTTMLSQLTPEAVEDLAIIKDDGSIMLELTECELVSTQFTTLFNGEKDVLYADLSFNGVIYSDYQSALSALNGGE